MGGDGTNENNDPVFCFGVRKAKEARACVYQTAKHDNLELNERVMTQNNCRSV